MDRRSFLAAILAAIGLGGCARAKPEAGAPEAPAQAGQAGRQNEQPWPFSKPGRVVLVRCREWKKRDATRQELQGALDAAVSKLTGATGPEAWRMLVRPRENVAIKVNCLAGPMLCTSPALAYAIADCLTAAGHEAGRLWIYDRMTGELEECGYEPAEAADRLKCLGSDDVGYEEEVTVSGSVGVWFSLILAQWADACINVPIAKDHDLAGITGALKNHLGSISNPNKLHMPDIHRAIVDVNLAPAVRGKQRLVVYDMLKVCYEGGPSYKPATTTRYGAIAVATDPVAADAVAVRVMDELRADKGLQSLWQREAAPRHVKLAAAEGLGAGPDAVEVVEVELG